MSTASNGDGHWRSLVAIGDSFTEGLDDPVADGTYRGWADLVAAALAARSPGFQYANLAIRGRLFAQVADEQVELALAMGADLVSFAAGGNDALRRGFVLAEMIERFDGIVRRLRGSGADVLLFRFPDLSRRLPMRRVIQPRILAMNEAIGAVAARNGALLVDLEADPALDDPREWSEDRLHLNERGHRRVAAHVLAALGVDADPAWAARLPPAERMAWRSARGADVRWVRVHLAPWVHRRLTGRSSGDLLAPKRPDLRPW